MTIVESQPGELVRCRLDFLKPFASTDHAEFTFQPEGAQTAVIWSMTGHNYFFFRAMSLFMDCDKMVGGAFEKGLADLKTVSEPAISR